jgi:uncharacterized membrane protein
VQSKKGSLAEALTSTAVGYIVAMFTWYMILWTGCFDISTSHTDNFIIQLIFTVVSIARGYLIRRYYNWRLHR